MIDAREIVFVLRWKIWAIYRAIYPLGQRTFTLRDVPRRLYLNTCHELM